MCIGTLNYVIVAGLILIVPCRALNTAIQAQFREFLHGFATVMDGKALQLFLPQELELLVCGTPQLNFSELQEVRALQTTACGSADKFDSSV